MKYFLTNPSAFSGDARGHILNQIGHMLLIGFLPAFFFPALAPVLLIGYAVWEYVQFRYYGAKDWDCIEDFGHVFAGVAAAVSTAPLIIIALSLLWIASGALRRIEEANSPCR